jgi:L-alanine-DL-glutamate epimerase-like enolase superfamily enzyme
MTTTLIPIEHVERRRQGLVLRRRGRLAEASPLVGRSRESLADVMRAVTLGQPPPPSLDFALWALEAELGRTTIASQTLLEDPQVAVAQARAAIANGQRAFKLKIRSAADAAIALVLRALGPELVLRVDANRAFASEAQVPWDELARARVAWIEEPCPQAAAISRAPVAIALDESVEDDAALALDAIAAGRATALVLKPTLLGARETLRVGQACRAQGGRAIVSHAFESEIGRRAVEELARRIAPDEIHGVHRWTGIDAFRVAAGGAAVSTLLEGPRVDSALG